MSGLVVATRLFENAANTVIVLEAGSDGFNNPNIANLSYSSIEALPGSSIIAEPRGKVLGGSSAMNGGLFTRPNKIDLDLWELAFVPLRNWNTISAAIKTAEHFSATVGLTSILSFHGTSGPIFDSQQVPVNNIWKKGVIPAVLEAGGTESID
ncbi:glucose-methanol-choline oxidoreductase [Mycena rebaudengoi]|nr:glucose-methanol-choline oxidoreductase [Mycena rebaudengoi]